MLGAVASRMRDFDLAWFLILATWEPCPLCKGVYHLGSIADALGRLVARAERGRP